MGKYRAYESYKDSGVEWLGKIPEHWKRSLFKYYFDIQLGKMLQNESQSEKDEEISYLKAIHVRWDKVNTEEELPKMWASPNDKEKYYVRNGDLLICEGGEVGRTSLLNGLTENCIIQNALHRIRPLSQSSVEYLNYLMRHIADTEWFDILCNKSTIAHLTSEKLGALPFPLPSLEEQKTIARFLDYKTKQIDALIAKKETLLEKLDEKRTALISHAVTKGLDATVTMKDSGIEWLGDIPKHWEVIQIKRAFVLQRGIDIRQEDQTDGVVPVVSSGGVASYHNVAYSKAPGVLVGRKGTLGNVHYVNVDYWPHDTTLWVINFYSNKPRFIYYKLLSMDLKNWDTGSANPTLNRNLIHPLQTSWTSPKEQKEIAEYLDRKTAEIDGQKAKIQQAINLLKEYRTALITNAVTGKIDVRQVSIPRKSLVETLSNMKGSEENISDADDSDLLPLDEIEI